MTYSVVARCPETGMFGVAVATRNLAVGSQAPHVRAGVGAISNQGNTNLSYTPRAFELLGQGRSADEVVELLAAEDDQSRDIRQVGLVGRNGTGAAFTGDKCVRFAGHLVGDGVSFQANMARNPDTLDAMAKSWEQTAGQSLDDRMLAALEAAEGAGGDIRGRQSAAMKVAGAESGNPWDEILVDLRVDDHSHPLVELRRLVSICKAHRASANASMCAAIGDHSGAEANWNLTVEQFPERADPLFWRGVFLMSVGRYAEARQSFESAFAVSPDWQELLMRLAETGAVDASVLPNVFD